MKHQGVVETPVLDVIVRHGGDLIEHSTAVFSRDEVYRYSLTWQWSDAPLLTWCMLNPSKATQDILDPTVTRCRTRTLAAGYGGFRVLNLRALRSTDPDAMIGHSDPNGPLNDQILATVATGDVVCAWGTHRAVGTRGREVVEVLRGLGGVNLLCLGVTKHGHPRHPLFVPMSQGFEPLP